mmetsp:Transcript_115312/g.229807  ORF Transcript_115312/g.229807 Transcript_115312/m.229807 type:complete len:280 (-) Transcript_115312:489-1328(-)
MQAKVGFWGPCACAVRTTALDAASQPSRPSALLPQASSAAFMMSWSESTDATSDETTSMKSSSPATQRHSRTFLTSGCDRMCDFLEVLNGRPPTRRVAGSLNMLVGLCSPTSAKATSTSPLSPTLKPASVSRACSLAIACGSQILADWPSVLHNIATQAPRFAVQSCTQGCPEALSAWTNRAETTSAPSVRDFILARSIHSVSTTSMAVDKASPASFLSSYAFVRCLAIFSLMKEEHSLPFLVVEQHPWAITKTFPSCGTASPSAKASWLLASVGNDSP